MSGCRASMTGMLLLGLGACAAPARLAIQDADALEYTPVNVTRTTQGGATFLLPAGWSLERKGALTLLTGPEPDVRVGIVEVATSDPGVAIARAWQVFDPGFRGKPASTEDFTASRGWEKERAYVYEFQPSRKLNFWAIAQLHEGGVTVFLNEESQKARDLWDSQLTLVYETLHPRGYVQETVAGKVPHALDQYRLRHVLDLIDAGRRAFGIPGVAVSLVQDGKVLFAGGFGERELGKPEKVDADTLFRIDGDTTELTTLMLATEVAEHKFTWNTPVTDVYPSFAVGNPETTHALLMKHLTCDCSGLTRSGFEFYFQPHQGPAAVLRRLKTTPPSTRIGDVEQQQDLLTATAGYIGGALAYPGKELTTAYVDAMRERVFEPLGMSATTFDTKLALSQNHATPHGRDIDGKPAVVAADLNLFAAPLLPALGAWSNVSDLTRYVQMELANGRLPNDRQLASPEAIRERRMSLVSTHESSTYGMGLAVSSYSGVTVVHAGGVNYGYRSDLFWLPDYGVGGVILMNANGARLPMWFADKVLEELFDLNLHASTNVDGDADSRQKAVARVRPRLAVPPAAEVVQGLAPRYRNASLGTLEVRHQGADCVLVTDGWTSPVATLKSDDGTMSLLTTTPGMAGIDGWEFFVGRKDGKRTLSLLYGQNEYVFVEDASGAGSTTPSP